MKSHDEAGADPTVLSETPPSNRVRSGAGHTPPLGRGTHSPPDRIAGRDRGCVHAPSRGFDGVRPDAVKRNRAFGSDANEARSGPTRPGRRTGRRPKGLNMLLGLHLGPKKMRIPPLRSAVQMGSDVSPGSSVTPGL